MNSSFELWSLILYKENSSLPNENSSKSSSDEVSLELFIHFDLSIASMVGLFVGLGFNIALIRFLACLEIFLAGLPLTNVGKSKSAIVIFSSYFFISLLSNGSSIINYEFKFTSNQQIIKNHATTPYITKFRIIAFILKNLWTYIR